MNTHINQPENKSVQREIIKFYGRAADVLSCII